MNAQAEVLRVMWVMWVMWGTRGPCIAPAADRRDCATARLRDCATVYFHVAARRLDNAA